MIGVQLISTGEFLDLFPDTSINLKLINPIFADDGIIPGSYSIPFSIPVGDFSPKNEFLLKNPTMVNAQQAIRKFDVRLYFDNVLYKTGQLWIRNVTGNKATADFKFGISTLATTLKNMRLKTLLDHQVTMVTPHTFTKKVAIAAKTTAYPGSYTIRINGAEFTASSNSGLAAAINASTIDPRARATYVNSALFTGAPDYFTVENYLDPNSVDAPLKIEITDDLTYKWGFDASTFENDYNGPLITWLNNYISASPSDSALRFGLVKNSLLYKEEKQLINTTFTVFTSDWVNLVTGSGFKLNKPVGGSSLVAGITIINPVNYSVTSPFVRVKYIIDKIIEQLGITVEGDFTADADYPKMVMLHSNCLETPIEFVGSVKWLATRSSFNISEFVPDWSVPDFLKALQNRFNLAVYFNERSGVLILKKRDPVISNHSYTDWTSIAQVISSVDLEQLKGLALKAKRDSKDVLVTQDDIYEVGNVELTINSELSSPVKEGYIYFGGNGYTELTLRKFQSIYAERPLDTAIPGVIGLYELRASLDSGAINYPAIKINGTIDGSFSGVNGLATKSWKSYIRFMINRKTPSAAIDMQFRHLLDLDWTSKYRIDNINYLVKSLDVTLTMTAVKSVNAELYTVDLGVIPA